jgi:hypothetical protein
MCIRKMGFHEISGRRRGLMGVRAGSMKERVEQGKDGGRLGIK